MGAESRGMSKGADGWDVLQMNTVFEEERSGGRPERTVALDRKIQVSFPAKCKGSLGYLLPGGWLEQERPCTASVAGLSICWVWPSVENEAGRAEVG